jgi:hypothetical protein
VDIIPCPHIVKTQETLLVHQKHVTLMPSSA